MLCGMAGPGFDYATGDVVFIDPLLAGRLVDRGSAEHVREADSEATSTGPAEVAMRSRPAIRTRHRRSVS